MSNIISLMDQLIDDNFQPLNFRVSPKFISNPAVNVTEHKDKYEVSVAIPGIDSDKVKIEIRENILNFSYQHEEAKEDKESEVLRQEYSHFTFSRSIAMPKDIDTNSVKASSKKGILYITINKIPQSQPKVIKIEKHD